MSVDSSTQPQVASFGLKQILWLFLGALGGIGAAYYLLPLVLPSLAASITQTDAKVYWYLSRSSAIIAFVFLWLSMLLGLLLTTKIAKSWPGPAISNEYHQYVSLLGLFFVFFHVLILIGDGYMQPTFAQLFIPWAFSAYRPFEVALGQIGLVLWLFLIFSFYVRKQIGRRTWRMIHFSSFVMYLLALIHGITSGSDTGVPAMQLLYWVSGASVVFLVIFRILSVLLPEETAAEKRPPRQVPPAA